MPDPADPNPTSSPNSDPNPTDIAGSTSAPQTTIPLTAADLMSILQTVIQLNTNQQAAAPATQQSPHPPIPAFISTHQPLGKSLYSLFPSVEVATILDVVEHKLKPVEIMKLDSKFREKRDIEGIDITNNPNFTRDYPSLNSIIIPLQTYFQILTTFATSSGNAEAVRVISSGGFQYTRDLHELYQQYEWEGVLNYHMHFHAARRREMIDGDYTGWQQPSQELIMKHLIHRVRPAKRRQHPANSASAQTRGNRADQPCYAWNDGRCHSFPCPHGRAHKCRRCGSSDHTETKCKRPATASSSSSSSSSPPAS